MKTKEELNAMTKEELVTLYLETEKKMLVFQSLYETESKAHEILNDAISAISGVINITKRN